MTPPRKNGKGKATPRAPRGRRFAVTLNNPTDKEKNHLLQLETKPDLRYIVAYNEIGENKTKHLQCYVEINTAVPLHLFKRFFGSDRAHVEFARSDAATNITYCKKDGDLFCEFGKPAVKAGEQKAQNFVLWKTLIRAHSSWVDIVNDDDLQVALAKYPSWVTTQFNQRAVIERNDSIRLQRWQANYMDRYALPPDPRKIDVVVDAKGGRGKSWLTKVLVAHCNATIVGNKDADAAYAWQGEKIIIFDVARSRVTDINWGLVEKIKDGLVFSPKYQSGKKLYKAPHVLVCMNAEPDLSKMSADRWNIITLDDSKTLDFTEFEYKWDETAHWYTRVQPAPLVRRDAFVDEGEETEDLVYSGDDNTSPNYADISVSDSEDSVD